MVEELIRKKLRRTRLPDLGFRETSKSMAANFAGLAGISRARQQINGKVFDHVVTIAYFPR
jgi:hypothetical protein